MSVEDIVLSPNPGTELLRDPESHLGELGHMAGAAEQVLGQRVAPLVRLVRQLHLAVLAHVAVDVVVLLHRNYSHLHTMVGFCFNQNRESLKLL